jgi:hypothetical protein
MRVLRRKSLLRVSVLLLHILLLLRSLTILRRVVRRIHRPATLLHMLLLWYRRCRRVFVYGDLKRINHMFIYNIPKPSLSRIFKTHTHTIHS